MEIRAERNNGGMHVNPKELVTELRTKLPEDEKTECTIAGKVTGDVNCEGIISITNKRLIFYSTKTMKSIEFYEIINIEIILLGTGIRLGTISENIEIANIKTGDKAKFIDLLWSKIPINKKTPDFVRAVERESLKLDELKSKCLINEATYNKRRQKLSGIAAQPKCVHPKKGRVINIIKNICVILLLVFIFNSAYSCASKLVRDPEPISEAKSAFYAAREFIGQNLKVPSSADYSRYDESETIKTGYKDEYKITTEVESENSFGAKLKKTFVVKVKKVGDNWVLVDLKESE